MEPDPFDDLLGLEERFYDEGFQIGTADGEKAGRIEGRVFGLEKGFEKYVEAGRLHGRSLVWISRTPSFKSPSGENQSAILKPASSIPISSQTVLASALPNIPSNSRLEKHLRIVYALTEPPSLSTDNSEDAVSDFDDRLKRAIGRVKMIERLVGEDVLPRNNGQGANAGISNQQNANSGVEGNIEDVSILKARH
jgi:hypothetical protein